MLNCKYCNRECKNDNSQRNHERLCKENPDRQFTYFHNPEFQTRNGENQYTKAKRLGLPKPEISDKTREAISIANRSRTKEWNEQNGKKISESIRKRVEEGTWHTSLAKRMHIDYNGVDLHGSWELKYVQYLENNRIRWIRNKESFSYFYDGKQRKYTPDFYLIDTDEYIEIKGYKTGKDEAKWNQFPSTKKLIVLMKDDLERLNIL